jgi:hypothetical protein
MNKAPMIVTAAQTDDHHSWKKINEVLNSKHNRM